MKGQMEIDSEILSLKESIKRSDNKIETLTKEMSSKDEEMEKVIEYIKIYEVIRFYKFIFLFYNRRNFQQNNSS